MMNSNVLAFGLVAIKIKMMGEKIIIIGIDDVNSASWPFCSLTTCKQPICEIIYSAGNPVLRKIARGKS